MKMVTCNKCGWVHFEVTRKDAEREIARFSDYFDSLPKDKQDDYYGGKKSSIGDYDKCNLCGGSYKNFRDSKKGDCPDGCTINPVLGRLE